MASVITRDTPKSVLARSCTIISLLANGKVLIQGTSTREDLSSVEKIDKV